MTRRQTFTQAQLRNAAKVAREHGVSLRLDPDGSITISPSSDDARDEALGGELETIFERHHARRGLDELFGPGNAKMSEMDPNSRKVLSGGYLWDYDNFKAHIADKPLNRREIAALEILSKFGVGTPADFRRVKIGLETHTRLEARGYIELRPQKKFPDRVGHYVLTEEGLKAWEAF